MEPLAEGCQRRLPISKLAFFATTEASLSLLPQECQSLTWMPTKAAKAANCRPKGAKAIKLGPR
jgi:hypothetical protein